MIKRLVLFSLVLILSANLITAQEMTHQHDHNTQKCEMCCCEKEFKKCNHMCHRMLPDDSFKLKNPPDSILDDPSSNEWLRDTVVTVNKGLNKLSTWTNEACIEMCKDNAKVDFRDIKTIVISCYGGVPRSPSTLITDQWEIKMILQSLKRRNRFLQKPRLSVPDLYVRFEDINGKSVVAIQILGHEGLVFGIHDKYYYRLRPTAQKIIDRHHSCY